MYTIAIGNSIVKRYKCQWHNWNGKYYVAKTKILHAISLQSVKDKAIQLFGSKPDNIRRI